MVTMDDVRDQLFLVAERILGRSPTQDERTLLVDAYNSRSGPIYDRCLGAISDALGIEIRRLLVEKTASVDRVRNALANLQAVAAQATQALKP